MWAGLTAFFSTDLFSGENTSRFILPVLQWLFPGANIVELLRMHYYIRKGAHVLEYFVLSILVLRGIRGSRSGWRWSWGATAVLMAAGWAALDELHQAFVPSRGPSIYDVMIDVCGAVAAQVVYAAVFATGRREAGESG